MDSRGAIQIGIQCSDQIVQGYLSDLTDAELLVRPVPGINHIAWQLGHLIASEHGMLSAAFPGSMPALPAGFAEKHSKETAASDNPADFLTKAKYLELMTEQRQAALASLAKQSDADLDLPSPESVRSYAPTMASLFSLIGSHWMMHVGQWAVIRRKLGRPPLF
jgi:uncharacterized damage-inducible protein DinB